MKTKILIILLFFLCSLFFTSSTLAIGIGAQPSFLDLELKVGQPKETKILVYNISQGAGIFQVFPEELRDLIEIRPDNFRLEAGESKEVKIKILAKEKGIKATNLSVLAIPLDRASFSVSPGLKIPLRLNIEDQREFFLASLLSAFKQNSSWILIGILVTCLVLIFLIKYFQGGRKKISSPKNLPIKT